MNVIWKSRIDMTTESTITPTYPSLCLYQSRRCCFVGVGSGKRGVLVHVGDVSISGMSPHDAFLVVGEELKRDSSC